MLEAVGQIGESPFTGRLDSALFHLLLSTRTPLIDFWNCSTVALRFFCLYDHSTGHYIASHAMLNQCIHLSALSALRRMQLLHF